MYPVKFQADYVEKRSRLTTFFRGIMVIPLFIVAIFWGLGALVCTIAAWFVLLFTARYPQGLYDFNVKALRFGHRMIAYYLLMTDEYPSFGGDDDPNYPVRINVAPPAEHYSRLKTGFRIIVGIPVYIMQYLYNIVAEFVAIVSWVVIVITGKQPLGLQDLMKMSMSYNTKAQAYFMLLTEQYPPVTDREQLEGTDPSPQLGVQ
jgi:hypothetical protein